MRKPNPLLDTYQDRPAGPSVQGFLKGRRPRDHPPLHPEALPPLDLLPKEVRAAENGHETLRTRRTRGIERPAAEEAGQNKPFDISEGTTEVLAICGPACTLALEGVHSCNTGSHHIPFDDIIPLQSWFSRAP